jgi:hypothetical protein
MTDGVSFSLSEQLCQVPLEISFIILDYLDNKTIRYLYAWWTNLLSRKFQHIESDFVRRLEAMKLELDRLYFLRTSGDLDESILVPGICPGRNVIISLAPMCKQYDVVSYEFDGGEDETRMFSQYTDTNLNTIRTRFTIKSNDHRDFAMEYNWLDGTCVYSSGVRNFYIAVSCEFEEPSRPNGSVLWTKIIVGFFASVLERKTQSICMKKVGEVVCTSRGCGSWYGPVHLRAAHVLSHGTAYCFNEDVSYMESQFLDKVAKVYEIYDMCSNHKFYETKWEMASKVLYMARLATVVKNSRVSMHTYLTFESLFFADEDMMYSNYERLAKRRRMCPRTRLKDDDLD